MTLEALFSYLRNWTFLLQVLPSFLEIREYYHPWEPQMKVFDSTTARFLQAYVFIPIHKLKQHGQFLV